MKRFSLILGLLLFATALFWSPEPSAAQSSDTLRLPGITCFLVCEEDVPAAPATTIAEDAVEVMRGYIGQRETHGYNRSPLIDRWNRNAGVPLKSSYCMAAVVDCFREAAEARDKPNPLYRTASVSRQLKHAAMIGSGLEVIPISRVLGGQAELQRGDVLCYRRGGGSDREIGKLWLGHGGVADSVAGSYVFSIEANTSPGRRGSQRNGDGVWDRKRQLKWWLAAIRVPA